MEPKVEIEFERPSKTYSPGDKVKGRLLLIFTEYGNRSLQEIVINLEGKRKAFCNSERVQEFYFCENQLVLLHKETSLPPNELVEFPFELQLPAKLPSSFTPPCSTSSDTRGRKIRIRKKQEQGSVEYWAVVKIRRRSEFDYTYRNQFYVQSILELNPVDASPVELHYSKRVGFCFCFNWKKGHRFGLTLRLPKDEFVSGECVDYTIKIWNSSNQVLKGAEVSIIREAQFMDSANFKTVLRNKGVVSKVAVYELTVKPGGRITLTSLIAPCRQSNTMNNDDGSSVLSPSSSLIIRPQLSIPPDTPPTHLGCKSVIQLDYFIKVSVGTLGLFNSTSSNGRLHCKRSIIIGSAYST